MISGRDVNFDDERHILTINGEKHAVGDPGEIEELTELIGDISETGLTGETVAAQLTSASERIETKANTTDVDTALSTKADITTVTIPVFTPSEAGWRRICKIKPVGSVTTADGLIYVGGGWTNGQPPSASAAVSIMATKASLTLLSSTGGDVKMTAMRLVHDSVAEYWLDVYFVAYSSNHGPLNLTFTGDIAVSDIQNPISITTDATAATDEISLVQNVSGTVLTDINGATKVYVDNVVNGVVMHVAGDTSITIPLSDSYTACIFGTISITPISAVLTVVTGGTVDVTDLTSNSLATRADITVDLNAKTITIASKNTDKFYVNILC